MIPGLWTCYSEEIAQKLGHLKPDELAAINAALDEIQQQEEPTLRLYAIGRVTEDIWNKLWREWQDRRHRLTERREMLAQQHEFHINNLDAALHVISRIGVLYDGLEARQKQRLLRDVIERVIVDTEGNLIRLELLPPFAYLTTLCNRVCDRQDGPQGEKCKTPI